MIEALPQTRNALTNAHRYRVQSASRIAGARLLAISLSALIGIMVFDVFFPTPAPLRGAALITILLYIAISIWRQREAIRADSLNSERIARILEEQQANLDNALINAVQFEAELSRQPQAPTADLMRREMARAEDVAAKALPSSVIDLSGLRRNQRMAAAVVFAAILSVLLIPRFWRFEIPRIFLFWKDNPAFTLTDFLISPGNSHVKAGGSLAIQVKTAGLIPDSLSLVTINGNRERSTPLAVDENGGYSQTLENITEDITYLVRANTGRSKRYFIYVDKAPEVNRIVATIHPPTYSHRQASKLTVGADGLKGLNSSSVELEIEASRPVTGGSLTVSTANGDDEMVKLSAVPDKPAIVRGVFNIRRDGAYRIDLIGADGIDHAGAARGKITLLHDEKPLIYITAPGQNAVAAPSMQLPIRAEAEDDIALQRIDIHRIVNGMADSVQSFTIPGGRQRGEANLQLDLKDLGARPGDVIQYYATAYDNDPGKPNLTDSERYWLWVVSDSDYKKIQNQLRGPSQMAAEYRAQTDALNTVAERQQSLADRMKQAENNPHTSREQMSSLQREQGTLQRDARSLADSMRKLSQQPPQVDAERGMQRKLAELAKQVEQAASDPMKQAASNRSGKNPSGQAQRAAEQLKKAAGQGQKSIEKALKTIEALAPLYEDVKQLQELAKIQRELATQARQQANQVKQDAFNQSRLKDLAEKQQGAEETLNEVRRNLEEHAAACETTAPAAAGQAKQLAQALDKMQVSEQMQSAASSMRKNESSTGADQAEAAQRSLDKLFEQGKGTQGAAKKSLDSQLGLCLGQQPGNTLEQMCRGLAPGNGRGAGNGQGQGVAQGQGGQPAPQPGSRPGDSPGQPGGQQRQMALLSTLQQQSGHSKKQESRRHGPAGEAPAALGNQDVERLSESHRPPTAGSDPSNSRYPVEYRRLVKDYFQSVAGGK